MRRTGGRMDGRMDGRQRALVWTVVTVVAVTVALYAGGASYEQQCEPDVECDLGFLRGLGWAGGVAIVMAVVIWFTESWGAYLRERRDVR